MKTIKIYKRKRLGGEFLILRLFWWGSLAGCFWTALLSTRALTLGTSRSNLPQFSSSPRCCWTNRSSWEPKIWWPIAFWRRIRSRPRRLDGPCKSGRASFSSKRTIWCRFRTRSSLLSLILPTSLHWPRDLPTKDRTKALYQECPWVLLFRLFD